MAPAASRVGMKASAVSMSLRCAGVREVARARALRWGTAVSGWSLQASPARESDQERAGPADWVRAAKSGASFPWLPMPMASRAVRSAPSHWLASFRRVGRD